MIKSPLNHVSESIFESFNASNEYVSHVYASNEYNTDGRVLGDARVALMVVC